MNGERSGEKKVCAARTRAVLDDLRRLEATTPGWAWMKVRAGCRAARSCQRTSQPRCKIEIG
jgi:hypothetical protein